jgi:hypothetical protein
MRGKCSGEDLGECRSGWEKTGVSLTFTTGIGLDKFVLGTRLCELWGQPSQLGQDFVDQSYLGGQVVFVEI